MAPKTVTKAAAPVAIKAVAPPAASKEVKETKPRMTQALKLRDAIEKAIKFLENEDMTKAIALLKKQIEVKERKPNLYNKFVAKHMDEVYSSLKAKDPNADRKSCMGIIAGMWTKEKESNPELVKAKKEKVSKKVVEDKKVKKGKKSDIESEEDEDVVEAPVKGKKGKKSDSESEEPKGKKGKAKSVKSLKSSDDEADSDVEEVKPKAKEVVKGKKSDSESEEPKAKKAPAKAPAKAKSVKSVKSVKSDDEVDSDAEVKDSDDELEPKKTVKMCKVVNKKAKLPEPEDDVVEETDSELSSDSDDD